MKNQRIFNKAYLILTFSTTLILGQSYVDHFDNLDNWTNTTNSSFNNEEWYIDINGYDGNGARSDVGGYGYGDQLTQSFTFNSEATIKLWVKKQAGDGVRIYLYVDDVEM